MRNGGTSQILASEFKTYQQLLTKFFPEKLGPSGLLRVIHQNSAVLSYFATRASNHAMFFPLVVFLEQLKATSKYTGYQIR